MDPDADVDTRRFASILRLTPSDQLEAELAARRVAGEVEDAGVRAVDASRDAPRSATSNTVQLYELIAKHRLPAPEFEIQGAGQHGAQAFTGKLTLRLHPENGSEGGSASAKADLVQDNQQHRSKRDAKEAAAGKGVELIHAWLRENGKEKDVAKSSGAENKSSTASAAATAASPPPAPTASATAASTNAVGLLLEFCNAQRVPQPEYTFHEAIEQSFACEVALTLPLPTPHNSDKPERTETRTFGSATLPRGSKKAAKAHAAQTALDQLRTEGYLDLPPRKKKKLNPYAPPSPSKSKSRSKLPNEPSTPEKPRTGTVYISGQSPIRIVARTEPPAWASPSSTRTTAPYVPIPTHDYGDITYSAQAARLCVALGLAGVQYNISSPPGLSSYSGAAYFTQEQRPGDPVPGERDALGTLRRIDGACAEDAVTSLQEFRTLLRGPVGEVLGVFGKKRAKEACAEKVVKVLRAELKRRLAGAAAENEAARLAMEKQEAEKALEVSTVVEKGKAGE